MRRLVTGIDDQGRSCVVSEIEVEFPITEDRGVVAVEQVYTTNELPPPSQTAGRSDLLDMGFGRGLACMIIRWKPDSEWPPHYTDTIDVDIVLEGSIELVLDDGAHHLEPGDSVVVHGVDHAWRVGKDGCTTCVVAIATPRD
jgi:quercetin dioxygenase-like cupin family protein